MQIPIALLLDFGVLIGAVVLSFVTAGFIDARLSAHHPAEKDRLGAPFLFNAGTAETRSHQGAWLRFVLWQHLSKRDFALSALCLANVGLYGVIVSLILGLWSPAAHFL
ncbi:MAG: hypothetical protein AAF430_17200 [Myxococcota bacterium]